MKIKQKVFKELDGLLPQQIDLIVMGSHGHTGLYDWIFGETIVHVRHAVKVPVLAVK